MYSWGSYVCKLLAGLLLLRHVILDMPRYDHGILSRRYRYNALQVLAAINEALEDSREGERNDQVKVIQQMMSPAPATSGGTACSLEVSTSAKFDKATLGSSYKVRYRSLAI